MRFSRISTFFRRLTGRSGFRVDEHFKTIYERNLFKGQESRSGTGSSLAQTTWIRQELPGLLARHGIKSFLDAPCGDCHWVAELDWSEIDYTGADVVAALIQNNQRRLAGRSMKFLVADLCRDPLPRADLIFCRDCWVHLDYTQIRSCVENFRRSGATYLLTTTFTERGSNRDLRGAIWRSLNLRAAPFSFPEPLELLTERCTEDGGKYADKALGLWKISDLSA
jgi:SAM-dependent methyltransferase